MESYQMLFPCSSSTDHHHHVQLQNPRIATSTSHEILGYNEFYGGSSLMKDVEDQDHDHVTKVELAQQGQSNNNNNNGEREDEGKLLVPSSIKKGSSDNNSKKIKKPKYAFQTRSHVDILDDGYRWRKYGQKAVKNNKHPRSYYRCTYQGCNVKKQVQRLTKDDGVVVTTYEGIHSHAIEKQTDNFEHILSQMQIYTPF
ncbi:hypothetical protein ACFE04_007218 [Oxalis oulophora]